MPSTPSVSSAPYSRASSTPAAWSVSTRPRARSRSSSSGPNWIDLVGQAWAHAGSIPPFSRS